MPRWHFLDFSVLCSVGLFFFFFVLRMRAFSFALKHQHHQKTRIETRRRDSTSLRPGRRTATMMMRKLDTKTRERERERKEERLEIFHPLCPLVAFLSFGRHFVCSHFFGFFKREADWRRKRSILCFRSFRSFSLFCLKLHQKKLRV